MEKNIDVWEKYRSHTRPNWGLDLQPRHVPRPGMEPVTFHFVEWCSTSWATLVRAALIFKMKIAKCLRVGLCWRGHLRPIWGKHFTSSKAPHSWGEGLSFQGICLWLVSHKRFQVTKQGLSFKWSHWKLISFFHSAVRAQRVFGIACRDSLGDTGEIWSL